MKKQTLIILAILASFALYGQEIAGTWNGVLKVQGMQLRIVFNISQTEEGYSSTMDSPDQGAYGIPVSFTSFEDSKLVIKLENLGIEYNGVFDGDSKITGIFNQAGQSFPLDLAREEIEKEKLVRPQESIEPIVYLNEEVKFENSIDGVVLAGTLSLPGRDGPYPAVILISGSGPQNRNEEVFGHKPFLVLADHLTKNGIAVLRFDDRGIGASTGDFGLATSRDYARDVESALKYLQSRKEIDKKRIGLIGHSEGGMIAPMVASSAKGVDFIVLLAGPGIRGDKLLLMQQELMLKGSGVADEDIEMALSFNEGFFKIIVESENPDSLGEELADYFAENLDNLPDVLKPDGVDEEVVIESQLAQMTNPWMQFFIRYDPVPALQKVKCPILAINGEKDIQVPAKVNLKAIEEAAERGKCKSVTVKELPNLNHLFQECETGMPIEYGQIEQTFSPIALTEIENWILKQVE